MPDLKKIISCAVIHAFLFMFMMPTFAVEANEQNMKKDIARAEKNYASSGDTRFPVKGGSGSTYKGGLRNSLNYSFSLKNQSEMTESGNCSPSRLSPEKLRDAYTAGYARSPVSPYAGLPMRQRRSIRSEDTLLPKQTWDSKYRKNSFASRPVDMAIKPAMTNASSGNPNLMRQDRLRSVPESVIIEKNGMNPGEYIRDTGVSANIVRILLKKTSGNVNIETVSGILVSGGNENIGVTKINGKMTISAKDGKFYHDDQEIAERICQIKPTSSNVKIDGKPYRGYLTLGAEGKSVTVVNHLSIEEYLLGVVASEMPASWGEEALKAQAVAARSYAVFHLEEGDDRLWDLESTEADQVYGGMDAEKPQTTLAVYGTKGQIIMYSGKPAEALYHADSGGYTDSPGDVWKKDYPYLRSVSDRFTAAGGPFKWEYFVPAEKFFSRLRSAGISVDSEDEVRISETTRSGRVVQVAVGDSQVAGNRLRQILDPGEMKSAKYEVKKYGGGFLFAGKGYGHGVGLSQNGAKQMASMGYSYKDILRFYYKGVCIGRITPALYANRDNPYRKKEIYQ